MKNKQPRKLLATLAISTSLAMPLSISLAPAPANAFNPFNTVKGILKQAKGSGLSIVKTAISNPVSTFRLLNSRVFKVQGTEKYLKYYDKYGKYLKYVPGLGGQPFAASTAIDIIGQQAGLKNGVPTDLNSILDEILGPEKNRSGTQTANSSSGCFSASSACGKYDVGTLLEQIERESAIASTGALGIPDPAVLAAALKSAQKRGLAPDPLISNSTVSNRYIVNDAHRKIAKAKAGSALSEEGQKNSVATLQAIDAGLEGVVETATAGMEQRVTQDVVKALLSVASQQAGFQAMQTVAAEQGKIDNALILNQLANNGQTADASQRKKDVEQSAMSLRLLRQSRRRFNY